MLCLCPRVSPRQPCQAVSDDASCALGGHRLAVAATAISNLKMQPGSYWYLTGFTVFGGPIIMALLKNILFGLEVFVGTIRRKLTIEYLHCDCFRAKKRQYPFCD